MSGIKNLFKLKIDIIKLNIIFSILLKGLGFFSFIFLVPLSLEYLGKKNYGIWLTISSVISWNSILDFGLTHGLRNKLAQQLSKKNFYIVRKLLGLALIYNLVVSIIIFLFSIILLYFININKIFKISNEEYINIVKICIFIMIIAFIIQFLFKPLHSLIQAMQYPFLIQFTGTLGNLSILLLIFISLTIKIKPELIIYSFINSFVPVVFTLILGLIIFYRYSNLRPSLKLRKKDFKIFKGVFSLSLSYFFIQICIIIIFSTDNLIISYFLSPEDVSIYSIVYKYFSIILMIASIIMTSSWSTITYMFEENNIKRVKSIMNRLFKYWFFLSIFSFTLYLAYPYIFNIWLKNSITPEKDLMFLFFVYTLLVSLINILSSFSNGLGKIRIQLISYLVAAIINIPLSILFVNILSLEGIILATNISLLLVLIGLILQYYMILYKKKREGIWIK